MKFLILLTFAFAAPAYGRRVEMVGDDVMYAAGSALECDLCEMFVGDLQKALQSKENEIMDAADELCASTPTIFGRNCSEIMDEVIAILFQVVEDLTPNEICQEIQLCDALEELRPPRRSQRTFVRMLKFMMQKAASRNQIQRRRMIRYLRQTVGDDYQCDFCKGTVSFLYDAVTCNETLAEIVNLLIPTCDLCPKKPECIKYFEKLPEYAKAFADKFLNSDEDCTLLGLCPEEELDDAWMWEGFWEDGDEEDEEERLEEEEEELLDMVEETEDLEDEILDQLRMKKKKAFWRRYRSQASQNAWAKKAAALRKMKRPRRSSINAIEVVLGDTIEEAGIPYEVSNNMQLPEGVTCDLCDSLVLIRNECLNHHEENFYNTFTTYFTDLCEKLPGSWRAECTEDIAQEVPRLLYEMLRNIMQPRSVCGEILEVCSVDQAEELV